MAKIDSVYDYYLSTYGPSRSEVSRYDSHKKNELRKVYSSIMKSNTESPLYRLTDPEGAKRYAIDIKEQAKAIQNVVASLSMPESGESAFQKKVAATSNENVVKATYIGDGTEESQTTSFDIEVKRLAAQQINTGNYLDPNAKVLPEGAYSFDLNTNKSAYEFQFNVGKGDSNLDVQNKIARLINKANLGIKAELIQGQGNKNALQISSRTTGLAEDEEYLFQISSGNSMNSLHAMQLLGIDQMTQGAQNSSFLLNGIERNSFSNTFTINKTFELTLNGISEDGVSEAVGFKANVDAVADNINTLVDAFNNILDIAANYRDENTNTKASLDNSRLYRDMSHLSFSRAERLSEIGLDVADDGKISINKKKLTEALQPNRIEDTLSTLDELRDSIGEKAENASINPMNYVQKVVVAYKNPGHNFATPYISSIYSGMILDSAI